MVWIGEERGWDSAKGNVNEIEVAKHLQEKVQVLDITIVMKRGLELLQPLSDARAK